MKPLKAEARTGFIRHMREVDYDRYRKGPRWPGFIEVDAPRKAHELKDPTRRRLN
jgi:hypothetical protein